MTAAEPTPAERIANLEARNRELEARNRELEARNRELEAKLAVVLTRQDELERANAELLRKVTGRTTERRSRRRTRNPRAKNDDAARAKRKKRAEERKKNAPVEDVNHALEPSTLASCPSCGEPMSSTKPETSNEWEWRPGHFVRLRHSRERAVCACGHFAIAAAPARVVDGGSYGPGFYAHIITQKLLDAMPLHRQVKALSRQGVPVARSTLVDLYHRAAELLMPLYDRMLERVPDSRVVHADETSLKIQKVKKLAYIWTFTTSVFVAYVFSPSRSSTTPERVLGSSPGVLVVDGYTGYNSVTVPDSRIRAGCNAHARRKFAHVNDPDAEHILELYQPVWDVEREAKALGIVGTPEHLKLRRTRAGPAMQAIKAWCEEQAATHAPKSAMGEAIRYVRRQYVPLTRFLDDVEIAPDNNIAERVLRIIALGRKNWLFVGHETAGHNSAVLASLLATCVLCGVNPVDYIRDVLIRIQTHPHSRIDDLLPDRWKVLFGSGTAATTDE